MVIKLGINGFGRVGRIMFRTCFRNQNVEVKAINDPAIDVEYICYLIKFDSTHGNFNGDVRPFNDDIKINGNVIKIFREKQPFAVPWRLAGVEYVIESSGMFTNYERAMTSYVISQGHLAGEGVRRVVVTAPSADVPMLILGVNNDDLPPDQKVISSASSTLYCLAPIIKVLETDFGVSEGFVTSIHAMTPSLKPLDGLCLRGKHWRDYRSIHQNIIPATTGACKALGKIMPRLKDKLVGMAFRVPIVNVSVLDLTVRLSKDTSLQKIVESVEKASKTYLKGVLDISIEEAVSSDFIRDSHSCILDINSCIQLKPNFYKLICWYENEYSYACRVIDTILFSERQLYQAQVAQVKNALSIIHKKDLKQQAPGSFRQFMTFGSECGTKTLPNVLRHFSKTFDFKIKSVSHCMPVHRKLPIASRVSVVNQTTSVNFETNSKSDIFKIIDYDSTSDSPNLERNSTGSCIKLKLLKPNKINKGKVHYRTVKVKKEDNEMVNTTEESPEKLDKVCQSGLVQSKACQFKSFKSSLNNTEIEKQSRSVQSKICQTEPLENSLNSKEVKEESCSVQSKICQPESLNNNEVKEESRSVQSKICQPESLNNSLHNKEVKEESRSVQSKICQPESLNNLLDNKEVKEESRSVQSKICQPESLNNSLDNKELKEESRSVQSKIYQSDSLKLDNKEVNEESRFMQSELCQSEPFEASIENKEVEETSHSVQSKICQFESFESNTVDEESDPVQSNSKNNNTSTASLQNNSEDPSEIMFKCKCEGCLVNCDKKALNNSKQSQPEDVTNDKTDSEGVMPENYQKNIVSNDSKSLDCVEGVCRSKGIQNELQQTTFHDNSEETIAAKHATTCLQKTKSDSSILKQNINSNSEERDVTVMENYEKCNKDDNKSKVGNIAISKDDIDLDKPLKTTAEYTTKYIIAGKIEEEKVQVESKISRPPCLDNHNGILKKNVRNKFITSDSQEHLNISIRKDVKKMGQDIYDKLDSTSATDSDNSFDVNEKKSQIIHINDLTNSLEDLRRLEKICKIIEISDDLSDELFAKLQVDNGKMLVNKQWSFKDFCEKINLDDFCNKVFCESNVQVNLC